MAKKRVFLEGLSYDVKDYPQNFIEYNPDEYNFEKKGAMGVDSPISVGLSGKSLIMYF